MPKKNYKEFLLFSSKLLFPSVFLGPLDAFMSHESTHQFQFMLCLSVSLTTSDYLEFLYFS